MYFGRAKVHKAPGIRKKQSFAPFAHELRCNITRPSQTCHSNPICLEQGVAKLVPHGCIRKITPMLHSNILTQWPAQDRDLRCVFIDAGFVLTLPFTGDKPRCCRTDRVHATSTRALSSRPNGRDLSSLHSIAIEVIPCQRRNGTVEKSNARPFVFRPLCEFCTQNRLYAQ